MGTAAPYRVLVVDDEPAMAELVGIILGHHGLEVLSASDGLEAVSQAQRNHPDVVLLDLMMPKLDGLDVCRALRDEPDLRDTTIVLCSAADEAAVDWRAAGADAFLQKPFNVGRLPALISRLVAEQPHRPDNTAPPPPA